MGRDIEAIAEEFLQVASHLRLGIILHLKEKNDTLSSLGKKLDVTASEMHRNLKRLSEDNLILKNHDGEYYLTPYGQMVYAQVSSWEFVMNNSEYFTKHSFGTIPLLFLQSLGSLKNSQHIKGFVNVQDVWKKILTNSQKYVNNILFEVSYDDEILSIITNQFKKKIKIQSIFLEGAILSESRKKIFANKDISNAIKNNLLVRRTIKNTNTLVVLNENESFVMFPKSDGEIDVSQGFYSDDDDFHHWCAEYFSHCMDSSGAFFEEKLKK